MNISHLFNLQASFCTMSFGKEWKNRGFVKVSSFLWIQFVSTWSTPAELMNLTVKLMKLLQQISEKQEMRNGWSDFQLRLFQDEQISFPDVYSCLDWESHYNENQS